jgi:RNA polymerase sigma factor for flagellar operon FliA
MSNAGTKIYRDASLEKERQDLVVSNLPFVRHVLGKLVGRLPSNVDVDNLESAGVLGLVEASHQFDPARGVAFRTFAYPRVWGAIIDELRRNSPLPQKLMNRISLVTRAQETIEPPITAERLAAECGLPTEEVEACLMAMRLSSPSPLNEKALNVVSNPTAESVSAGLEYQEAKQKLADCIERLPEQQRLVLTMYYSEDLRLKEIGSVMNLSESRISRILAKAELQLREALHD